ncbi:MAG: hypothetical protein J7K65_03620, partial [Planctomycetes bacterium]|nr:hypothetical protein [Planctomycetota bacterium]
DYKQYPNFKRKLKKDVSVNNKKRKQHNHSNHIGHKKKRCRWMLPFGQEIPSRMGYGRDN